MLNEASSAVLASPEVTIGTSNITNLTTAKAFRMEPAHQVSLPQRLRALNGNQCLAVGATLNAERHVYLHGHQVPR